MTVPTFGTAAKTSGFTGNCEPLTGIPSSAQAHGRSAGLGETRCGPTPAEPRNREPTGRAPRAGRHPGRSSRRDLIRIAVVLLAAVWPLPPPGVQKAVMNEAMLASTAAPRTARRRGPASRRAVMWASGVSRFGLAFPGGSQQRVADSSGSALMLVRAGAVASREREPGREQFRPAGQRGDHGGADDGT
jgi:hypothetical protein